MSSVLSTFIFVKIQLIFIHLRKFCRLVRRDTGVNNLLDISVHNLIQLIQCQIDPVIRYASLREIVSPYLLGTVSRSYLASAKLRFRIVGFLLFNIV